MNTNYPVQTISKKEKLTIKEGELYPAWIKSMADYYTNSINVFDSDRNEILMLRNVIDGIIDNRLYDYVLNPYDVSDTKLLSRPAKLRNYDFITSIIRSLVGERADLPVNFTVVAENAEVINEYKQVLSQEIYKELKKRVINNLNQSGINTGLENKKPTEFKDLVEGLRSKFDDEKAKDGETILEYISYMENLADKYQDAWCDYLTVGSYTTYKDVIRNDVKLELCRPEEIYVFDMDKSSNLIEDAGAVVRFSYSTPAKIVDRWRSVLKEHQINKILNTSTDHPGQVHYYHTGASTGDGVHMYLSGGDNKLSSFDTLSGKVGVYHLVWKTLKKIGILQYQDVTGSISELEVNEDYNLNKEKGDISITWEYINEVWQVWKVGNEDDALYFDYGPIPVQRNDINNTSQCKLPYNGKIGYTRTRVKYSIVKQLLSYQLLYNIYHYRFEMLMAKNKDKLMMMPFGLIPQGWKMEKWMYFVEATGVGWFDETNPKIMQALSAIKGVDLSLGNYIEQTRQLMESLKHEAFEAVGINSQRLGSIKASEKKGNVDQAIYRSSLMTAEISRRFDDGVESDLNGLLDYSKVAFIDGKKARFLNRRAEVSELEIDGLQHLSSSYGVFVKNTKKEQEKIGMLKDYAFSLAQNDRNPAMVANILDADSISSIVGIMNNYDSIEKEYQKSVDLEKDNLQLRSTENLKQIESLKTETERYKVDMTYKGTIEAALIKADQANFATINSQLNDMGAEHNQQKMLMERDRLEAQNRIAERKQSLDEFVKNTEIGFRNKELTAKMYDLALKNKKIDNDLKIAKENKNKHDV
jgi:hypothetical protein